MAVKTLSSTDPEDRKKFAEETELMKLFSHRNIVSLLGESIYQIWCALCSCVCVPITVSLCTYMGVCDLSVCPFVCLSVHLSVCPSVHLSVHLSARLSVHLSVHLSVCLSVCLSVMYCICTVCMFASYMHRWEAPLLSCIMFLCM